MLPFIIENQSSHLMIYTDPPFPIYNSVGKIVQLRTMFTNLFKASGARIETVHINGTHHFHMMKPEETANLIIEFLERINDSIKINSNL